MGHLVQIPVDDPYRGCYYCENGCYPGREHYEEQQNAEGRKDHPHAVADDRTPEHHSGVRSKPAVPLVGIVHVQMMVPKMRLVDGYAEHRLVLNEMDSPRQPQSCEVGGRQNEQEVEIGELQVQHRQFSHFPWMNMRGTRRRPPTQNAQRSPTWASRCEWRNGTRRKTGCAFIGRGRYRRGLLEVVDNDVPFGASLQPWRPTPSNLTRVTSAPDTPRFQQKVSKTFARYWTKLVLSRLDPQQSPKSAGRSRTSARVAVRSECRLRRRRCEDGE